MLFHVWRKVWLFFMHLFLWMCDNSSLCFVHCYWSTIIPGLENALIYSALILGIDWHLSYTLKVQLYNTHTNQSNNNNNSEVLLGAIIHMAYMFVQYVKMCASCWNYTLCCVLWNRLVLCNTDVKNYVMIKEWLKVPFVLRFCQTLSCIVKKNCTWSFYLSSLLFSDTGDAFNNQKCQCKRSCVLLTQITSLWYTLD